MMIKSKSFVCAVILLATPLLSHGSYQADSRYPVRGGCDTATIKKQILAEIHGNREHHARHVMGRRQLYLLVTGASSCKPCKDQLLHEAACLAMEWGKSAY
jgi:hypothetical protein